MNMDRRQREKPHLTWMLIGNVRTLYITSGCLGGGDLAGGSSSEHGIAGSFGRVNAGSVIKKRYRGRMLTNLDPTVKYVAALTGFSTLSSATTSPLRTVIHFRRNIQPIDRSYHVQSEAERVSHLSVWSITPDVRSCGRVC